MNSQSPRNNIDEVSFMRPILILLLILYHAMCIYTGNWILPIGVIAIPVYDVIGKLAYSFMLESFVFISGYIWAFQREELGKRDSLVQLLRKKAVRLLIPTLLFGVLYIMLIQNFAFSIRELIIGPGHLWFMPMLFYCFVLSWAILQFQKSAVVVMLILLLFSAFSDVNLPLRFSKVLYYEFYFMLGYYSYGFIRKYRSNIQLSLVLLLWVLFTLSYIVFTVSVIFPNVGGNLIILLYACPGTLAFFATSVYVTSRVQLKYWYIRLGALCMGVYVFQQFILKILYYKLDLPLLVNNYLLPWLSFAISLVLSILFTIVVRKSRIGRRLL